MGQVVSVSCKNCHIHGMFVYSGKDLKCPACGEVMLKAADYERITNRPHVDVAGIDVAGTDEIDDIISKLWK